MDRLTSMAVFVKAVDVGSFAAAADALEMSAPMVGKHVRFLEERLGVRLLNRTTRRQSLTETGQAYYERCRTVLAEAVAADAVASDELSEPRGRLRVTMPALLGRHCIAPLLMKLARRYPHLELDLSFGDPIADIIEGRYDLAIRTGDLHDQSGLMTRRIASQRMVVCGTRSYLRANGKPKSLDILPSIRRSSIAAPDASGRGCFPARASLRAKSCRREGSGSTISTRSRTPRHRGWDWPGCHTG